MEFKETVAFTDLGLSEPVLRAVKDIGYEHPTPIQAQAIPIVLMCRDVLGIAQTGTGKTAAFTMPMIDILAGGRAKARMPRSLILSPTRELAAQIAENFDQYGKYHPLTHALIVGGTSMDEQIKNLDHGVDVLIATPGRLLDLFSRGKILLADIKILVIDEADRMLDMGFIPDLEKISSILPPIRQTLFFSATMPPPIKKLADRFLVNPKTVSVSPPSSTAANVEHFLVKVSHSQNKSAEFIRIFQEEDVKNAFIFCNRKRDINDVCRFVRSKGIKADKLHGDMEQSERTVALNAFKNDLVQILVCSDVAARGLDVQGMSHVFNWDVPFHAEDYIHRIGRTGRAGATGRAFTFSTPNDFKAVAQIEKLIGQQINIFSKDGENETSVPPQESHEVSGSSEEEKKKEPSTAQKRNRPRRDGRNRHSEHGRNDSPAKTSGSHRSQRVGHRASASDDNKGDGTFGADVPTFLKSR